MHCQEKKLVRGILRMEFNESLTKHCQDKKIVRRILRKEFRENTKIHCLEMIWCKENFVKTLKCIVKSRKRMQ
jgi:hypothetical protein